MENAAVTSLCNRTGVHIGGALQNAHTHNAPRVASAMWLRNGRGFSLQLTKPTIIILAERSNLTFTRSGAAASSLDACVCAMHEHHEEARAALMSVVSMRDWTKQTDPRV